MKSRSGSSPLEKRDQIADNIDNKQESPCRSGSVAVLTNDDEVPNQDQNEFENAKTSVRRPTKKKKLDNDFAFVDLFQLSPLQEGQNWTADRHFQKIQQKEKKRNLRIKKKRAQERASTYWAPTQT